MADYLRFVCEPMWDIIDTAKGYYPVDPNNLTPSEVFDRHLNIAAIGFLKRGMNELTRAPFLHLTNTKELWDSSCKARYAELFQIWTLPSKPEDEAHIGPTATYDEVIYPGFQHDITTLQIQGYNISYNRHTSA